MSAIAHVTLRTPSLDGPRALVLPFPRSGSALAQSRSIPRDGFLLGRGERVFDEPFDDPAMSLRHAEVLLQGAGAMVHDLGSAAGTRLNGAVVQDSHVLAEGDVLRLGDTMLLYTTAAGAAAVVEERLPGEPELT